MKKITQEELNEILKKHKLWLNGEDGGERADLENANFEGVELTGANLAGANLANANLENANLAGAYLEYANLEYANLYRANLENAYFAGAYLTGANLAGANLEYANLAGANLEYANLEYANLEYAYLYNANLKNANLAGVNLAGGNLTNITANHLTSFFYLTCPKEGSYIGYKKCADKIVKLQITEDALRSSATTRKCRASKAKVLSITNINGSDSGLKSIASDYDGGFIYTVGDTVEVKDFNTNRWEECAAGIHHFITRQEAVDY